MTLVECSWQQAREAAQHCAARLPAEHVPVDDAVDRVLAQSVLAGCNVPSFDTSAMDGWAVAGNGPWQTVGDAPAGRPYPHALRAGEAIRIATGGVVPAGTTGILRREQAAFADGVVSGTADAGGDIRRSGEEVRVGDPLADAGTAITPALAGFLAATGHDVVPVVRQPRVAVLVLGDELLNRGLPAHGRIRDSLGPQLPGWLGRLGAVIVVRRQIADDLESVSAALAEAITAADLVLTTGGTAAGPRDHMHAAIADIGGELRVDRVAVRPGHPMLLATAGGIPIVGLPGNPHSAIIGLMTLGEPILRSQLGMPEVPLPEVRTADDLRTTPNHTRLIAGNIREGVFELSPYGGSAMLRGLAQSTGFAVVSADVPAGARVPWLALPA